MSAFSQRRSAHDPFRGTRLGSYEILAAIGVGGMGEVYRARDTKLGRDVAIKILPTVANDHVTGDDRHGDDPGTAAYMAPEQAAGKAADKRADIWSFGVVVWEMLTGERLFGSGETTSHVVADVLRARQSTSTEFRLVRLGAEHARARVWDLAADGRIAVVTPVAEGSARGEHTVVFVQNFFDEIRRRVK